MFGDIPLKSRGYYSSAVIIQERLLLACVRYVTSHRKMDNKIIGLSTINLNHCASTVPTPNRPVLAFRQQVMMS